MKESPKNEETELEAEKSLALQRKWLAKRICRKKTLEIYRGPFKYLEHKSEGHTRQGNNPPKRPKGGNLSNSKERKHPGCAIQNGNFSSLVTEAVTREISLRLNATLI